MKTSHIPLWFCICLFNNPFPSNKWLQELKGILDCYSGIFKKHFSTISAKNILRVAVNVINTFYSLFLKEIVVTAQTYSS